MQKKHADRKRQEILPPPQPATNGGRAKASRKSRRRYAPMLMTGGEGECGCGHDKEEAGREEAEEEKQKYVADSNSPKIPQSSGSSRSCSSHGNRSNSSGTPSPQTEQMRTGISISDFSCLPGPAAGATNPAGALYYLPCPPMGKLCRTVARWRFRANANLYQAPMEYGSNSIE